ncbi:hypothetical protein RND71_005308 [Anisodus tanguticus]|uniref:DNA mismatch repair protein MutS-like N-terminal domain-containing protein n=1 Tax=Anisodus tanguticus TaxID=243964 RepID=A0AAE1STW9_9SOLA|nr:hypothetical protein RND71_005308 [Anisodus tanguticus]
MGIAKQVLVAGGVAVFLEMNGYEGLFITLHYTLKLSTSSELRYIKRKPIKSEKKKYDAIDYYIAHGDDATFIAKTYYHTTALRQLGNGVGALSSVSVSKNMFATISRDILLERMDRTLELYEGSASKFEECFFRNEQVLYDTLSVYDIYRVGIIDD